MSGKKKTFLIAVAVVVLAGASAYGYMKYLPEESRQARTTAVSDNLLAKAKQAEQEGNSDKALDYYQEYLDANAAPPNDTQPAIGDVYASMGSIYVKQLKYPKAIEYLKKGLDHTSKYGSKDSRQTADHWFVLASVYDKQGEVKLALDNYKNSRDILVKLDSDTAKVDKMIDELEDFMVNANLQSRSS